MNIFNVLGTVLVILKLLDIIRISWFAAILPFFAPLIFATVILIIGGIVALFKGDNDERS